MPAQSNAHLRCPSQRLSASVSLARTIEFLSLPSTRYHEHWLSQLAAAFTTGCAFSPHAQNSIHQSSITFQLPSIRRSLPFSSIIFVISSGISTCLHGDLNFDCVYFVTLSRLIDPLPRRLSLIRWVKLDTFTNFASVYLHSTTRDTHFLPFVSDFDVALSLFDITFASYNKPHSLHRCIRYRRLTTHITHNKLLGSIAKHSFGLNLF